jgi:FkbM family methyltransferase
MVISKRVMQRETVVVRALRAGFRRWPFLHGRGWLLRLSRLLLGRNAISFDIGGGMFVEGRLDDWIIVWTFMRSHEADAPFRRSLQLVRSGDVVFDVGATLGIWSLLAVQHVPGARVHAFEPVPELAERLRDHVARNDARGIVICESACGAENGSLPFFARYAENTGASSLARTSDAEVEIEVPVMMLDRYIEREGLERVDMMKVVVEGAEILVFRGARDLLSSEDAPMIFFEVNDALCASFATSGREVKQLLAEHGYGIYRWRDSSFATVPADEPQKHEDLFALKPRHFTRMQTR